MNVELMKFADGTYATDTLAKQTGASTTTAATPVAPAATVTASDVISRAASDNFAFKPVTSNIVPHGETGAVHAVDATALVSNVGINAALHTDAAPDHLVDHTASDSPSEAAASTTHHDVFLV